MKKRILCRFYSSLRKWTGPGTFKKKHSSSFHICLCCRPPGDKKSRRIWYKAAKKWEKNKDLNERIQDL